MPNVFEFFPFMSPFFCNVMPFNRSDDLTVFLHNALAVGEKTRHSRVFACSASMPRKMLKRMSFSKRFQIAWLSREHLHACEVEKINYDNAERMKEQHETHNIGFECELLLCVYVILMHQYPFARQVYHVSLLRNKSNDIRAACGRRRGS
jgi:hypothetical protein